MRCFAFVFILITICSCAPTHYYHNYKSGKYIDFTKGEWIVYEVQTSGLSSNNRERAQAKIASFFNKTIGKRAVINSDITSYVIGATTNNPNELLRILKEKTNYDFIFFTDIEVVNDDQNRTDAYGSSYGYNETSVRMSAYDIKTGQLIYEQQVTANNSENTDVSWWWDLVRSPPESIANTSLDRAIRRLKKYSYK